MGRREGKGSALLKVALMVAVSLQLLPLTGAQAPLLPPADLLLELRELVPNDFSLSATYIVTNIGGSASRACSISIWDEHDVVAGDGSLVLEKSLGELQPGRSITVELDWHPTTPSVHRLWAFVDPDNDVLELTKVNNIAFRSVAFPQPSDLLLSVDGLIEHNRSGTYLSGVPLELNLMATIPDGLEAGLFRFEVSLDNGSLPIRVWGGDGPVPTFDVGTLSPGIHRMVLSTTYAGVMVGSSSHELVCAEVPEWVWTLSDPEASFDREAGAYLLSGGLDVPTLHPLDEKAEVRTSPPVLLFDREDEVRMRAWMLPDLTTTFELELTSGMPHSSDGSPLTAKTRVFRDGMTLPGPMSLTAGSDIALHLVGRSAASENLSGPHPRLSLDPTHITANGSLSLELIMVGPGSGLPTLEAHAELELQGGYEGTTFHDTLYGPGGSKEVSADLAWSSSYELKDGVWTQTGLPVLGTRVLTENILSLEGGPSRAYASMSMSRMGPYSSVQITPWEGGQTALGMWQEGSSVLLRGSDGRMAEPCITALGGGDRVLLWTELTDDGTGSYANLSRRGIGWMKVDGDMFEKVPAGPLFPGPYLDMQPSVASSPDGSLVLASWVRDRDGNLTTLEDRKLVMTFYDGSKWSEPLEGRRAISSTALITGDGIPVVAYVDMRGVPLVQTLRLRGGKLEESGVPSELLMPEGSKALEVSALPSADGQAPRSGILLVRSGAENEGRWVLSVQTLERSTSLYGHISKREDVIAVSDNLMEGPCGDQLDGGYTAVMWREAAGGNGTLRMAASPAGADWSTWTGALDLDPGLPMTPSFSFRAVDEGKFWMALGAVIPQGNDTKLTPVRISLEEMTWACEIASMNVQSPEGYGPGDLTSVEVSLVNRGLVPDGTASIKLLRTVRSKEDGSLMDQHISTENVLFSGLNDRKVLTFPVTVADMQMGLFAFTGTPKGSLSHFYDEAYASLPAFPDPVIRSLSMDEGQVGGNVTVRVNVINMGHSRFEGLPLVLKAAGPTPPISFGPGRMEPVGIRSMEAGTVVASHDLTLGYMEEVTLVMGFGPGNGTTAVWAEVEGLKWADGPPRSERASFVRRDPCPAVRVLSARPLMCCGSSMDVEVAVENAGTGGYPDVGPRGTSRILPDGLGYFGPAYRAKVVLHNGTGPVRTIFDGHVEVPGPGHSMAVRLDRSGADLPPGGYMISAHLTEGQGDEGPVISRSAVALHVLPHGTLAIGRPASGATSPPSSPLQVMLSNPTARAQWGAVEMVANGRWGDGVILTERLVMSIAPQVSQRHVHRPQLKEGSYLLSASVLSFAPDALSSGEGMHLADTSLFEHHVVKDSGSPGSSGPDREDVTAAAVISGAAAFVVLCAGAVFRLEGMGKER